MESLGFKVIFGLPGMVLATIFVTMPFVVREVEPVLHEIGQEQEQAAATLGAGGQDLLADHAAGHPLGRPTASSSPSRVARRVRRGDHGVVRLPRRLADAHPVHGRYLDDHNTFGAYCAATLLMGMAVVALTLMTLLDRKRSTR